MSKTITPFTPSMWYAKSLHLGNFLHDFGIFDKLFGHDVLSSLRARRNVKPAAIARTSIRRWAPCSTRKIGLCQPLGLCQPPVPLCSCSDSAAAPHNSRRAKGHGRPSKPSFDCWPIAGLACDRDAANFHPLLAARPRHAGLTEPNAHRTIEAAPPRAPAVQAVPLYDLQVSSLLSSL